jgi:hypothetical protein
MGAGLENPIGSYFWLELMRRRLAAATVWGGPAQKAMRGLTDILKEARDGKVDNSAVLEKRAVFGKFHAHRFHPSG